MGLYDQKGADFIHMRKLKIFWKVFYMTITILSLMVVIAYFLLYLLLPDFYKSYKKEQYRNLTNDFVKQFALVTDFGEETELLSGYAQQNGIDLELRNEGDEVIFDFYQGNYIVTNWDSMELSSEEAGATVEMNGNGVADYENVSVECSYVLKDGSNRTLTVMVPLQPLNEAKEVMIRIYPVACVICIAFALVFAFVFSKIYIKPVKQISILARKMSRLEENVEIPVNSSDEIGELSQDINHLYQELKGTIDVLNAEIGKFSDAENRKIGFFRTVSHELKTPLAAANALLEGMIHEIPPYNANQKKYLTECRQFLEEAVELVKESLSFSVVEYGGQVTVCNVKDLVCDVTSDYMMIIRSKQIEYLEEIPADFHVQTRAGLLKKAVSNIVSNAVNYTPVKGRIYVYCKGDTFIIENTCIPLSADELDKIYEPFYSGNNDNKMSNGLGLSIVKQLFGMLHIDYRFEPLENGEGMKFMVFLNKG
jgi:signal transduction histidine kinase